MELIYIFKLNSPELYSLILLTVKILSSLSIFFSPHLEYCPYSWKDIDKLECVQKKATNIIRVLEGKIYEEHLETFGIFSLEKRRLQSDMDLNGCHVEHREDLLRVVSEHKPKINGFKL